MAKAILAWFKYEIMLGKTALRMRWMNKSGGKLERDWNNFQSVDAPLCVTTMNETKLYSASFCHLWLNFRGGGDKIFHSLILNYRMAAISRPNAFKFNIESHRWTNGAGSSYRIYATFYPFFRFETGNWHVMSRNCKTRINKSMPNFNK